jgi:aspartate racemase
VAEVAPMKTIGIIGGIGPESTIEYYRFILAAWRERRPDGSAPSILINSIDMHKGLRLLEEQKYGELADYLAVEIERLQKAGADFGLLAANSPHMVFDDVRSRSSLPLLSIVEATSDAVRDLGLKRPALFGTRFTMQGRFYPDVFSRAGLELVVPDAAQQAYIHDKYMNELLRNLFLPETRAGLLAIVEQMKERDGIDGLILGGTELPLILRDAGNPGIPMLDTTQIHVNAAVARLLA